MKRPGGTLTITVDPRATGLAASIRAAAEVSPLLCLSTRAFGDLAAELGGYSAAAAYLLELAEEIGHPIAVNLVTVDDESSTVFVAPKNWTEERLAGWAAGHHQELEAAFGPVSHVERMERIGPNRAERRRRRREN